MTRPFSKSIAWAAAAAAFLALGACNDAPATAEPPLAGADIGGAFALTDQDGKTVRDSDLDGKYRIVYFGYTYCPDVCPVDLQVISKGLSQFEKAHPDRADDIQPIFISVDPGRDTPEVMKAYVSAFHPRLIGLTGTAEQVRAVADKYGVYSQVSETEGASEYLVDHTNAVYLMGRKGEPLALLPGDGTPEQMAEEIEKWTRG